MSSKKVFKVYVNPKSPSSRSWVHITLNYIMNGDLLNSVVISGLTGKLFRFSDYQNLGLPQGYQIDYVSGEVPSEFYHDTKIMIKVIKTGVIHHLDSQSKSNNLHTEQKIASVHVVPNYESIVPYKSPYKDISTMLLALGYSLGALGEEIEHLRRI